MLRIVSSMTREWADLDVLHVPWCVFQFSNRVVASGRALLNRLLPDVYIYTDHYSGKARGLTR